MLQAASFNGQHLGTICLKTSLSCRLHFLHFFCFLLSNIRRVSICYAEKRSGSRDRAAILGPAHKLKREGGRGGGGGRLH